MRLTVWLQKSHGSRTFRSSQNISTLDYKRILDSDFIDLSNRSYLAVRYARVSAILSPYDRRTVATSTRFGICKFPPGTRGFLYFHQIDGGHPAAGTIRFRCTEDRSSFASGQDLLLPDGYPWSLSLFRAMSGRTFINVPETLAGEGFITPEIVDQLESLVEACRKGIAYKGFSRRAVGRILFRSRPPVVSFRQPFRFTIDSKFTTVTFADVERCEIWKASFWTKWRKSKLMGTGVLWLSNLCLIRS